MKHWLLTALWLCSGMALHAQEMSDVEGAMHSQAVIMANAYEKGNYDLLLNYTYPPIITAAGGREVLRSMVAQLMQEMAAQGYILDSVRIGIPGKIYAAGTEWHSIIPQFVYMTTPEGKLFSESALLAITQNKGARWYYLDTKQLTPQLKAALFPDFNPDLIIPEPKQSVITK